MKQSDETSLALDRRVNKGRKGGDVGGLGESHILQIHLNSVEMHDAITRQMVSSL